MKRLEYFENKNILVTGGTGSFGNRIVSRLLELKPNKVIIFSRDEKKQCDMQIEFKNNDLLEFAIGDVRDYNRVYEIMKGIDIVYHAAALKQVPNCEFHPMEAVKTNILGAENVRKAAIENNVDVLVAISTDKAVKPINVMGMTKAIQEKIMLNLNNSATKKWNTKFLCVRYGNVIGSRGSVIPFFKERLGANLFLPVTSFEMTRFLLTLNEAIDLVFTATIEGSSGQLFVKKMPACKILDLAKAMAVASTGRNDYPIKKVGIRPGEKIHEVLVSEEEMRRAIETKTHYVICPHKDLTEYTSNNTEILDEKGIISLLSAEGWL
jgi:UDP-N-acetylglucosamine 4,6-dehydratase